MSNETANDNDKLLDGYMGIAEFFLPAATDADRKANARTVKHWRENHGMPVTQIGSRIYGRVTQIREWLDKREGDANG